jgi:hypothetical protein
MKNNCILFFLLFFAVAAAQNSPVLSTPVKDPHYLQLNGMVKGLIPTYDRIKSIKLDSALVEVFDGENKLIHKEYYLSQKRVMFRLSLNQSYTVKVSKEGFVTKTFLVSTIVAKQKSGVYIFPFEVTLFKVIKDLNVTIDKPVAIIEFKSKEHKFDYDYEYTEEINAELKEKYSQYYSNTVVDY